MIILGLMRKIGVLPILLFFAVPVFGQNPQSIKGPDERYKVDILVVVAHPDDEGAVTPYLARAIYDLHKSVAVVFGTRGGGGGDVQRRGRRPGLWDGAASWVRRGWS